ncbi:hypothetical protein [Virgibacillus sp. DJP39]
MKRRISQHRKKQKCCYKKGRKKDRNQDRSEEKVERPIGRSGDSG